MLTPLRKRQIWQAIKLSKFPIIMGMMTLAEGSIDFACGSIPYTWVSIFRGATFYFITKEGIHRGKDTVRKEIIEKRYNEVADELVSI